MTTLEDIAVMLEHVLTCLERLTYEQCSGRRMEIAEYLERIVYQQPEDTTNDISGC
jgi:hypothetical protein